MRRPNLTLARMVLRQGGSLSDAARTVGLTAAELDLELWEQLGRHRVRQSVPPPPPAGGPLVMPLRFRRIVADVESRHRVRLSRCLSRKGVTEAHKDAWAKIRAEPYGPSGAPPTYGRISQWFGTDPTTVLHGVRAHERRMADG
jgi:transposase-like protein